MALDRGYYDFVRQTKCLEDSYDITTVANQVTYGYSDESDLELVKEVLDLPGHHLFVVSRPDQPDTMIPAVPAFIDDLDLSPTQGAQPLLHSVLQTPAFFVVEDLVGRRLAHVQDGFTLQVHGSDLLTHRPPRRLASVC